MSERPEVDPRIAQLEKDVEALKGGREASTLPSPKAPSQFSQGLAGQLERARQQRVQAAERAAERALLEERADAPRLAKLDAQVRELDDRIKAVQEMQVSVEADLLELCVERAKLAAQAARPTADTGRPLHIGRYLEPVPGERLPPLVRRGRGA